jgi:hypothetical protein
MIKIEHSQENIGFILNEEKELIIKIPYFIKNIKNEEKFALSFYQLLKKYKKDTINTKAIKQKDNFRITDNFTEDKDNNIAFIELYFSLLDDYQKNSLLLFKENNYSTTSKGVVNWSKTVSSHNPIINDNSIIYNKTINRNLNFNYYHPITVLYCCCLNKAMMLLDKKYSLPYDFRYLQSFEKNTNLVISSLKKYQRFMFSDREKTVFKILESILLSKNNNLKTQKGQKLEFITKFDPLWEKMLYQVIIGTNKENDDYKLAKGSFLVRDEHNNEHSFSGISLRPDLVTEYKNKLIIIDAKNYIPNFETNSGLPQSPDITKQIMYKHLLSKEFNKKNKFESKDIINVFLFPYDSKSTFKISFFGKHTFINEFDDNNLGNILCFYIDFFELQKAYLSNNSKFKIEVLEEMMKLN